MRLTCGVLVAILVSGCAGANEGTMPPAPFPEANNPPIHWFDLLVTGVEVAQQPAIGRWSGNCIALTGWGEVLHAVITAKWDPSVATPELELFVADSNVMKLASARGLGEVRLDAGPFVLDGRGEPNAFVGVQPPADAPATVTYGLEVELRLQVWFEPMEGKLGIEAGWGCGTEP